MSLIVRDVCSDDLNLIRDSFVKTVKANCPMTHGLDPSLLRDVLDKCLATWKCSILCHDSEPSEIMSYIIYSGTDVLWLATKPRYQKMGNATKLLELCIPKGGIRYAFMPKMTVLNHFYSANWPPMFAPYLIAEVLHA